MLHKRAAAGRRTHTPATEEPCSPKLEKAHTTAKTQHSRQIRKTKLQALCRFPQVFFFQLKYGWFTMFFTLVASSWAHFTFSGHNSLVSGLWQFFNLSLSFTTLSFLKNTSQVSFWLFFSLGGICLVFPLLQGVMVERKRHTGSAVPFCPSYREVSDINVTDNVNDDLLVKAVYAKALPL